MIHLFGGEDEKGALFVLISQYYLYLYYTHVTNNTSSNTYKLPIFF